MGTRRFVNIAEMADFDMKLPGAGRGAEVACFAAEQVLTGAMLALLKPETQVVYFLQAREPSLGTGIPDHCPHGLRSETRMHASMFYPWHPLTPFLRMRRRS